MNRQATIRTVLATLLMGSLSIAIADPGWGDRGYDFRPNDQGDFTNSDAWSGKIVDIRGDWLLVVRYGYQVELRITRGNPRLYVGERVRVVPFSRDGQDEIGELRLPAYNYLPVGVVRYVERTVAKERPPTQYGPVRHDGRWIDLHIGKYPWRADIRIGARW